MKNLARQYLICNTPGCRRRFEVSVAGTSYRSAVAGSLRYDRTFQAGGAVRPRSGFTLLELLAALVLASLMMVAAWRLLQTMHRQEKVIAASIAEDRAWLSRIYQRIEQDFRNSRRMAVGQNVVHLEGFAATGDVSSLPGLSPAEISYTIAEINGRSCLRREQLRTDMLSNQSGSQELIAVDVSGLSLWFADAPDMSWESEAGQRNDWVPVPNAIVVQLDLLEKPSDGPLQIDSGSAAESGRSEERTLALPTMARSQTRRTLLIKPGGR